MEQAPSSFIWPSLTYTSIMPSNFVLRLIFDCLTMFKFQPLHSAFFNSGSRTKTTGRLDNPILIGEQKYLVWFMCIGQTTPNNT